MIDDPSAPTILPRGVSRRPRLSLIPDTFVDSVFWRISAAKGAIFLAVIPIIDCAQVNGVLQNTQLDHRESEDRCLGFKMASKCAILIRERDMRINSAPITTNSCQ